jgi:metal-responsive CopG/Arc/MetJ family transcriptional regulator
MPKPAHRPLNPQVGARVPEDLLVEVKVLATRQRRRFNELVGEALRDLLKKYREKAKGKGK